MYNPLLITDNFIYPHVDKPTYFIVTFQFNDFLNAKISNKNGINFERLEIF